MSGGLFLYEGRLRRELHKAPARTIMTADGSLSATAETYRSALLRPL